MRRFIIIFLIFLCLIFNVIELKPVFATPITYKQGIYELSKFNISIDNRYPISNVSTTDSVQVLIFDKDYIPIQSIRLPKDTLNVDATIPVKSEYLLVIIGKGEVSITPKKS